MTKDQLLEHAEIIIKINEKFEENAGTKAIYQAWLSAYEESQSE